MMNLNDKIIQIYVSRKYYGCKISSISKCNDEPYYIINIISNGINQDVKVYVVDIITWIENIINEFDMCCDIILYYDLKMNCDDRIIDIYNRTKEK